MSLSYEIAYQVMPRTERSIVFLTGTFFCDSTTAHSFPLTPTDIILAAVIALKAYSTQSKLSAQSYAQVQ